MVEPNCFDSGVIDATLDVREFLPIKGGIKINDFKKQ